MSYEEILAALLVVNNQRCDPPLEQQEVERIVKSVCKYPPGIDPEEREPRKTQATQLVELAGAAKLFHSPDDEARHGG